MTELRIAYLQESKIFDPNLLYIQSSHLPASGSVLLGLLCSDSIFSQGEGAQHFLSGTPLPWNRRLLTWKAAYCWQNNMQGDIETNNPEKIWIKE